jgi:hypothetical protein
MSRPTLAIRLARQSDGGYAITCTRPDGTSTWQTTRAATAAFFPAHDLTHYAVETTLGMRHGFYGLVLDGWGFDDFASGSPRGAIPEEALVVEAIVGTLDLQRRTPDLDPAEFRAQLAATNADDPRTTQCLAILDDDTLARLVAARDALLDRWAAVPPGGALVLEFVP